MISISLNLYFCDNIGVALVNMYAYVQASIEGLHGPGLCYDGLRRKVTVTHNTLEAQTIFVRRLLLLAWFIRRVTVAFWNDSSYFVLEEGACISDETWSLICISCAFLYCIIITNHDALFFEN